MTSTKVASEAQGAVAALTLAFVTLRLLAAATAANWLPRQRGGAASRSDAVADAWRAGLQGLGSDDTLLVIAPAELAASSVSEYLHFIERQAAGCERVKIARGVCPVIDLIGGEARRRGYEIEWVRDRFERSGWVLTRPT